MKGEIKSKRREKHRQSGANKNYKIRCGQYSESKCKGKNTTGVFIGRQIWLQGTGTSEYQGLKRDRHLFLSPAGWSPWHSPVSETGLFLFYDATLGRLGHRVRDGCICTPGRKAQKDRGGTARPALPLPGALRGASSPLCPSHGPGLSHGAWGTRPLLSGSRLQLETGKRKGHVTGDGKDDTGGKPPQQAGSSQKKANEIGKQTVGKVITIDNKQQYICLKRLNSPGILCPCQQILKIHKYEDIRRN